MRRIDREMDSLFALQILDKCSYAVLSMITSENAPYCIPLSIVRIGNKIYFHSAKEGRKISTLRQHSQVCLSCVGDIHCMENKFTLEYESAVINGIAQEVFNEEEKILALRKICEKYTPLNMKEFDNAIERSLSRTAVWEIEIESITGKRKKYDKNGNEMKFKRME